MLDSFFEYTRLQADQEALTLQRMPLYPLLCETLLSYYAQLHEQGLDPVLRCSAEDAAIMMDPECHETDIPESDHQYAAVWKRTVHDRHPSGKRTGCTARFPTMPILHRSDVSRIFQRFYQRRSCQTARRQRSGHGHRQRAVRADERWTSISRQGWTGELLLIDMEMKAA